MSAPTVSAEHEPTSTASPTAAPLDWRAWLTALLFGLVAFALFTRNNDFPFYYHTDEPGKVRQVLTGDLNFHHPLLLLKSTRLVMAMTGTLAQPQPVAEAGRTVSAFFAAAAVVALVLLAWSFGGPLAAVLAGVLLVTHPVIFELAHYMKEDCSLLAGVAWSFFAMERYVRRPALWRAGLVGAAAGLAISGKAIGLAIAGVALVVILFTPRGGRRFDWKTTLVFLVGVLLVVGAINLETLKQSAGAKRGLRNELNRIDLRASERGQTFEVKYVSKFGREISVPILLATAFWIYRRWRERHMQSISTWVLIAFPLVFTAVLSVAPVTKERYLLPAFALFCVLGALGLAEMAATRSFRHSGLVAGLLAVLAVGWHLPGLVRYYREFGVDDRRELIAWIRENLPAKAIIAHDRRARLDYGRSWGDPAYQFPQETRVTKRYAADLGDLKKLRSDGINYVVACEQDYHTALRDRHRPSKGEEEREQFYRDLFKKGKLLWERPAGKLAYIHPGLRLYEIP
jgi:hypothetical protein